MLALAFKKIGDAFFVASSDEFRRLVFRARLTAAKVVQADVGDDAVEPGVEAALEAETMKIAVNLEKSFLINVAGIFRAFHQVQGEAQNIAIETADQFLKSGPVASLRFRHQSSLVEIRQR